MPLFLFEYSINSNADFLASLQVTFTGYSYAVLGTSYAITLLATQWLCLRACFINLCFVCRLARGEFALLEDVSLAPMDLRDAFLYYLSQPSLLIFLSMR
jgi:hypothetical protein